MTAGFVARVSLSSLFLDVAVEDYRGARAGVRTVVRCFSGNRAGFVGPVRPVPGQPSIVASAASTRVRGSHESPFADTHVLSARGSARTLASEHYSTICEIEMPSARGSGDGR